jgi:VIT1/CCC1 family predicted Fe2+/Mn2+ transporter
MVKQGPIPAFVHGLWEYIAGVALIAAPLVLGYDSGSATAASIVLGVLLIFLTATTSSSTSLVNQIPLPVHILLDYALAAILIASPFLFGFSDESTPTAVFIAGGVFHLLFSIGTRYRKEDHPERGTPKREQKALRGRDRPSSRGVRDDEIPEFEPPPRP